MGIGHDKKNTLRLATRDARKTIAVSHIVSRLRQGEQCEACKILGSTPKIIGYQRRQEKEGILYL